MNTSLHTLVLLVLAFICTWKKPAQLSADRTHQQLTRTPEQKRENGNRMLDMELIYRDTLHLSGSSLSMLSSHKASKTEHRIATFTPVIYKLTYRN